MCKPCGAEDRLQCLGTLARPAPCLLGFGCRIERLNTTAPARSEGRRAGRPEAQKPGRD